MSTQTEILEDAERPLSTQSRIYAALFRRQKYEAGLGLSHIAENAGMFFVSSRLNAQRVESECGNDYDKLTQIKNHSMTTLYLSLQG